MFTLLIRGATLPDGRQGLDVAIRDGHIAAVEPGIVTEARDTIDAGGNLFCPPFVDQHSQMDAILSLGHPRGVDDVTAPQDAAERRHSGCPAFWKARSGS